MTSIKVAPRREDDGTWSDLEWHGPTRKGRVAQFITVTLAVAVMGFTVLTAAWWVGGGNEQGPVNSPAPPPIPTTAGPVDVDGDGYVDMPPIVNAPLP